MAIVLVWLMTWATLSGLLTGFVSSVKSTADFLDDFFEASAIAKVCWWRPYWNLFLRL